VTPKPFTHRDAVAYRPIDWTGLYPPAFPKGSVPSHVAIVMDGNGRWANRRGLTPNNDGNVIRLQIPEMTEERRREMVKVIHGVAEEGRVAVRNIRRDVNGDMREMKKDGDVGEDEEHRAEAELQKLTDAAVGEIDALVKGKEEEILTV